MGSSDARRLAALVLRVAAVLLVAALAADLTYKLVRGDSGARLVRSIASGHKPLAPAFRLPVIWSDAPTWPSRLRMQTRDRSVTRQELAGYPVVLNFFASWCGPCAREARLLAAAARAQRGRVIVIGVDVNDGHTDAVRFLRAHHVPYVAVHASSGTVESFGLVGLPETFYLDTRGHIDHVTRGQLSATELQQGITRAAAQQPSG